MLHGDMTTMLHSDMNLSRITVYAQSIEESKLSRISRNMESSGPSEKIQPRFKKRYPITYEPRILRSNLIRIVVSKWLDYFSYLWEETLWEMCSWYWELL